MSTLLERLGSALADRYTVEREVGRGGMATVFLAEDLKHRRRVAIKVLHPELASTVGADRFLREVEIAAGLEHPHILTLLDSGEADGLLYYVMPYVEGESLRERLQREQQLPIEEAIAIAREVADGLGYAHRHGLIHRDVKPANIMLSEGHALIADFGVARAVWADEQALTGVGLAVGTPAYMSPEQAAGTEVDARSDLYSLGCVLYEMLAGLPPLTGATPHATAAMRMTETPTALPVVRETVPDGVDRVVHRLLAKSAADRYATAEKLLEALDGSKLAVGSVPERRLSKRVRSAVAAVVLLSLGALAIQWFVGRDGGRVEAEPDGAGLGVVPQRIAVLPFENRTGDSALDYLEKLVAERITARLQREEVGEGVASVTSVSSAFRTAGSGDASRAVAEETGAALVVTGSIDQRGDSLSVAIRLMDPVNGTLEGTFDYSAPSADMPVPGLEELASRLAGGLLLAFSDQDREWSLRIFPKVEAYRLFWDGKGLQLQGDRSDALDRYDQALAVDSTFPLPVGYAIGAQYDLGDYEKVDSLSRIFDERFRPNLTDFQRSFWDAHLAFLERDLETTYLLQRRALSAAPDRLDDVWIDFAVTCFATNRPHAVLETLLSVDDRLPNDPAIREWYLWYLANAYHMVKDHEAELEAARAHERLGLVEGRSKYLVARALAALGRAADVSDVQLEIEGLADATQYSAWASFAAALELRYHGSPDESRAAVSRALRWYEDRPDLTELSWDEQLGYGLVLYYAERWEDAERVLARLSEGPALEAYAHTWITGHLGLLAGRRGDRQSAAEYSAELERIGNDFVKFNAPALAWAYRGRIAAVLGQRNRALEYLKSAFDEALLYWPGSRPDYQYRFDFEVMEDDPRYRELLAPKG